MALGFWIARAITPALGTQIPSGAWFAVGLLACAAGLGLRGRWCAAALLTAVVALSAGWFTLRILETPADRLVLPAEPSEVVIRVEGVVVEAPHVKFAGGAMAGFAVGGTSQRLVIDLRRVEQADSDGHETWRHATGRLIIYADGPIDAPVGRRTRVAGRASGPGAPTNPGQGDQRLWSAQDAIVGTMSVPEAGLIEAAAGSPGLLEPVAHAARSARAWLAARARAGLANIGDERARALAGSLLLGVEEEEGRSIATQFQRLGLAHVLAISGVHVAMLAWATLLVVRLFGDFGQIEPLIAGAVVLLYLLVVPSEAPIIRSGVMVLALLIGEAMGRRYDGVVILAWTACALLIFRPMDLWSLGFQLSFGVTGVLIGAGRHFHNRVWGGRTPLSERVYDPGWRQRVADSLKMTVSASFLAWLVASPWIAARVGLFSPIAPISSLIVALPISLLMLVGFVALIISTLVPGGGIVWVVASPLARGTLGIVEAIDDLPISSVATGSIPLAWGAAGSLGMLWLLTRGRARVIGIPDAPEEQDEVEGDEEFVPAVAASRTRVPGAARPRVVWRAIATWAIVAGLVGWLALWTTLGRSLGRGVVLRIDTLDVGDATCHLIRSGDSAMLWDCGSSWAGAGQVRIPGAIRALGAGPVRTALVTHANFDHYNALPDVSWRVGVKTVFVSPLMLETARNQPDGAAAALIALLRERDIKVLGWGHTGNRYRLGEAEIEVLWPNPDRARLMVINDQSIVARIEVQTEAGPRRVLMTGDVQAAGIASVLGAIEERMGPWDDAWSDRRMDVMEAPHHGAYSSRAAELLETVGPSVVIQSTGRSRVGMGRVGDDRWREPSGDAQWLVTATGGATWVEIGRDGIVRRGTFLSDR